MWKTVEGRVLFLNTFALLPLKTASFALENECNKNFVQYYSLLNLTKTGGLSCGTFLHKVDTGLQAIPLQ